MNSTSNIEDYDDLIKGSIERVEKLLGKIEQENEADQENTVNNIQGFIGEAKKAMVFFKKELYLVPKNVVGEYKAKEKEYKEKLDYLDFQARKMEAKVKKNEIALLQME